MRKYRTPLVWPRRDPRHYRFAVPNEVWEYKLQPAEFVILSYRTHQYHPSYRTIAKTTGLSLNTVAKSVGTLADKGRISVERSCWFNEVGTKRNGNNLYTILPTRAAVEDVHQRQMRELEQNTARLRAERRLTSVTHRRPTAALCAAETIETTPDPPPAA